MIAVLCLQGHQCFLPRFSPLNEKFQRDSLFEIIRARRNFNKLLVKFTQILFIIYSSFLQIYSTNFFFSKFQQILLKTDFHSIFSTVPH